MNNKKDMDTISKIKKKISLESQVQNTMQKIIDELKKELDTGQISYADIGDYIYEKCQIKIEPEVASKILELCHSKIREKDYFI